MTKFKVLEFPELLENTIVPERKFLKRWGSPSRMTRKGKASPPKVMFNRLRRYVR